MDTAIMAARVALLILVTGLFAALWSGDHPDCVANAVQPMKQKIRMDYERKPSDDHSISLRQTRMTPPLPEEVAAGTYLVADQFGRTCTLIVSPQEVKSEIEVPERAILNHYSFESNEGRWHYIRIEQDGGNQTAARPELLRKR
jgi:hypothetical protein